MSASQEVLAEALRTVDLKIAERENAGEDVTQLRLQRQDLLKQLARVNKALNEGADNLLKG